MSIPETARIRMHLARTEADLRAHPPQGLSPERAEARKRRLDDLRAYWLRGEFPSNPDFPDSLVPYFIDARGVACAVGHLVIASGRRDFAEQIARTRNHAYIREIEDPRLAEWAEASGLTLEECARIQPAYGGPPTFPFIREMEVSPQGAVWTLAVGTCQSLCIFTAEAFVRNPGENWTFPFAGKGSPSALCLDPSGKPLLGFDGNPSESGLYWNGNMITMAAGDGVNDCDWVPDGSAAWVATNSGLRHYRISGNELGQALVLPPRDSTFVVAAGSAFVWSGTSRLAYGGVVQGSSAMNKLDSAGMAAFRVTGMRAQGRDMLWAGIDGGFGKGRGFIPSLQTLPTFSRRGLFLRKGIPGPWTAFNRANSSLPSDTILALAPADSPSVWIATAAGIFKFTAPDSVSLVHAAFGAPITDLAADSSGRLYAATWGEGVYVLENGSTRPLGYYGQSTAIAPRGRGVRPEEPYGGPFPLASWSLLGRKTGPSPAAGILVGQPAPFPSNR